LGQKRFETCQNDRFTYPEVEHANFIAGDFNLDQLQLAVGHAIDAVQHALLLQLSTRVSEGTHVLATLGGCALLSSPKD
jgi:hypothetical protein